MDLIGLLQHPLFAEENGELLTGLTAIVAALIKIWKGLPTRTKQRLLAHIKSGTTYVEGISRRGRNSAPAVPRR